MNKYLYKSIWLIVCVLAFIIYSIITVIFYSDNYFPWDAILENSILILVLSIVFGLISAEVYLMIDLIRLYYLNRKKLENKTVIPQLKPPKKLEAYMVGTIVDGDFSFEDYIALLILLSNKKYVKFEHRDNHLLIHDLHPIEVNNFNPDLLSKVYFHLKVLIFEEKPIVNLNTYNNFYLSVHNMYKLDVQEDLVEKGFYLNTPENIKSGIKYITLLYLIIYSPIFLTLITTPSVFSYIFAFVLLIPLFIYTAILFIKDIFKYGLLTVNGVELLREILGFRMFLSTVFRSKKKYETLDNYESYYPYAMALKIDNKYNKILGNILNNRKP